MMFSQPSFACLVAYFLPLISNAYTLPTEHRPLHERDASGQTVYYGINITDHEQRTASLKAEGYRPVSLNIYGPSDSAKFAAIWTKEAGPSFEIISGVDEQSYNDWQAQWKSNGYVSTHISVTGGDSSALYAGVMAQVPAVSNWVQACELQSPWEYDNITAGASMVIKGVSMYGAPSARRYCILGYENVKNQQQTVFYQTDSFKYDYETVCAAETQKRFWRPTFLDLSSDHLITPIFDDTSVGKWAAFTNLTTTQLAAEITKQQSAGLHAVQLSGADDPSTNTTLYTAIFAEHTTPFPRTWHASGAVTGFQDNAAVTTALDSALQTFMTRNGVRQAQVAASLNGTVIASRAYTLAEPDRAVVTPSDKFLLASVSKMFTHAAVQHLVDAGRINFTTQVYPLLGYVPVDERASQITVQQLLDHSAGYDRSMSGDIGFFFTTVAQANKQSTPATLRQVIEYVAARPLDFAPGTEIRYSNYGTMLMSYVLTNLTGVPYMQYIRDNVLGDLDVEQYSTARSTHLDDAISQETKFTGVSALTPMSEAQVPDVYGGDGAIKEEAVAAFGLKASAESISRFIGSHAAYGTGPRSAFSYRDGTLAGARTFASSMEQLDWALTLNTREYTGESEWEDLVFSDVPSVWNVHPLA